MAELRNTVFLPQYQSVSAIKESKAINFKDGHTEIREEYKIDGVKFQRVSTILNVINKPKLIDWAIDETLTATEEILKHPDFLADVRTLLEINEYDIEQCADGQGKLIDAVIQLVRDRGQERRTAAADRGTTIHEEITDFVVSGRSVEDSFLSPQCEAAVRFLDHEGITMMDSERIVWFENWKIAGTIDGIGRNRNGELIIWDWKTGSGPWPEMALQLGAYAMFLEHLTGEEVAETLICKLTPDGKFEKHNAPFIRPSGVLFDKARELQNGVKPNLFDRKGVVVG